MMNNNARNKSKYPWDIWFDGIPRKLTKGVHFDVSISSFRQIVYTTAERRGIKVSVSAVDGSLIIQALKGAELTISERRASLETRFDERELIEKCKDDLQLTENVLNRLNTKNEMELVRGRDYDISDIKLVRAIYNAAARQGVNTSRWKYERTKCGLRFYVEEIDDKLDKWVSELADIPQGEINKEIFEYKIYFKDPTGYIREQKAKFCSFCGRPIKKKDIDVGRNAGRNILEHVYKKVKLADLTVEEGRPVSATEKLVLKRIKDFVGTPISCAEKIRNVAIDKGINIDDWEFIFDNKNELVILCGSLAEQYRSYQLERRYIKLMMKKLNDPPSQVDIEKWVDILAEDNWLQIKRGVDYFCPEKVILKWISEIALSKGIKIGSYIPEGKIGDSDGYGMTFSTRKALPVRFKALDLEKPADTMKRMEELGYGYVIDQPFVNQRLEFEEQRQIKDTKYAKKLLSEELEQYKKDIAKVKVEGVRQILQEKIKQTEYKLEEVKQIEQTEQRKQVEFDNQRTGE